MNITTMFGGERFARFCKSYGWMAVAITLGAGSLSAETRINYMPIREANRCLPDAVGFQTSLQVERPGSWSRILKVNWTVRVQGNFSAHAYCIYMINHQLYAYDSAGGQRRLGIDPAVRFRPNELGQYLGGDYFASANYLPAFDPVRLSAAQARETVDSAPKIAKAD